MSSSDNFKWSADEKRRGACWRLSVKGTCALKSLMLFLVKELGLDWVDWCKQNSPVIKNRISYKNSKKLPDESEIPDPEAMDITYLAHVLRSLADDAMKEHV